MAEGLLEDCRQLLSRFESRRSVRFETFSQVWKEMNFSFIHCGKKDANGRIQIVDYLFRILTSYLSPSCTLIIREGAVYALYGVYNTQLCNPKVKIRMTLSMWKDLNELQEEMQELKHHDADFILRSLKSCKAFLFCATPTPLTYGSKEAIMNNEKENATKISSDSDKIIKRTCGTLERIYNVHMDYQEAKQGVLALPNSVYSTSLDTAFTNFDVELASDIEEFYKWKQAHCQKFMMNQKRSSILMFAEENISNKKGKQSNDDDGASTSQSSEPQVSEAVSRAKFLRGLKDKSFKQVAQVSRSMRHLKPTLHSEEEHNSSESS